VNPELLLLLGGGGAVAYVVAKPAAPPASPGPTGNSSASTPGATKGQQMAGTPQPPPPANVVRHFGSAVQYTGLRNVAAAPIVVGSGSSSIDATLKQKLDLAEQYAKAAYDNGDDAAKQKAADWLNSNLKPAPNPPLDASSSWDTVASVAGAAAGGAIGAYLGGPLGAKIGALLGAYLGVKLEDWCSRNMDDLKSWAASLWGDIQDFVTNEANDAYNYVSGLF
jgi:hypothetical protein